MATLAASLLLAAPDAQAGSYSGPSYSGGTYTNVGPGNTPLPDGIDPSTGFYGSVPTPGYYIGSASGQITAKFTWQPAYAGDLPPTSVIVYQHTVAQFSFQAFTKQTASCSDGLGDTEQDTTAGPPSPAIYSGVSSGTYYTVQAPDASGNVVLQCSPSASYNWSAPGVFPGGASVGYAAAVYPVIVTPSGAIKDSSGNWNILVGQHCAASLSGIPAALLNNTANPPTYQWSVSGTTFQSWTANNSKTTEVDGLGPTTNSTASWYWNDLSDGSGKSYQEAVSCTATVTPPAGQGAAFTVTASQPVTVWTPVWTCTGTGGNMQVNTTSSAYYASLGHGNAADFWLYAGLSPGSGESSGMNWYATITTPNSALFGNGSLAIAQLIIPDVSYTSVVLLSLSSTRTYTWSQNGEEVLDSYPYPLTTGAPNYFGGDSPGIDLSAFGNSIAGHVGDQFEDYLMYFAPGSAQCVPIAHFVWSTNGNASISTVAAGWASFGTGSAGAVTPSGTPTKFLPSKVFPMWTDFFGDNADFNANF